jgi:hypothetical protein
MMKQYGATKGSYFKHEQVEKLQVDYRRKRWASKQAGR